MVIEERDKEYILRFSKSNYSLEELRDFFRYLEFRTIAKKVRPVSQTTIDQLAEAANSEYWDKHSDEFEFLK